MLVNLFIALFPFSFDKKIKRYVILYTFFFTSPVFSKHITAFIQVLFFLNLFYYLLSHFTLFMSTRFFSLHECLMN